MGREISDVLTRDLALRVRAKMIRTFMVLWEAFTIGYSRVCICDWSTQSRESENGSAKNDGFGIKTHFEEVSYFELGQENEKGKGDGRLET